jgi:cell division protein FtsZ
MNDELNFEITPERSSIIKVLGVGGGGSNAVNHMYRQGIRDVDFVVCNTDAQALNDSPVPVKVQIGETLTEGLGAGNKPDVGRQAAQENLEEVMNALGDNTKMVFVTAGMGGGTGTGAAPVIAKACKEKGILTVAIVTIPFWFEGKIKHDQAVAGIDELSHYVDSLLVINNDKLREIFGDLTLSTAFSKADNILTMAAKGIAEIITVHGYINVDFADVETVMRESGVAILGSGSAAGENRALTAVEAALTSPLLNSNDITGAKNVLLNITSGKKEITMDEVGEITDYISNKTDPESVVIWGTCTDDQLDEEITVTIIATGFNANSIPDLSAYYKRTTPKEKHPLPNPDHNPELEIINPKEDVPFVVEKKTDIEQAEQQMLRFNVKEVSEPFTTSPGNPQPVGAGEQNARPDRERLENVKSKHDIIKNTLGHSKKGDDRITRLEEEPAFRRRSEDLDDLNQMPSQKKISKYSLYQDDDEKEIKLSDENPYLTNNVD